MEMLFKLNPHIPRGDTFQEEGTEMQSSFSGKAEGAGKEQNALQDQGAVGCGTEVELTETDGVSSYPSLQTTTRSSDTLLGK